jgi:general secretion pathway protein K
MRGERCSEGGFALLLVLWTMALLAWLVTQFNAAGRTEVQAAGNLREAATTQAAADGAAHEAIFRLLQGAWRPDGRPRQVIVGGARVELKIRPQAAKVNPNTAPPPVLQALLVGVGTEPTKAAALSRAIVDWRQPAAESLSGGLKLAQYRAGGRAG